MLVNTGSYDAKMIDAMRIGEIKAEEITEKLGEYLDQYKNCFLNLSQEKYFRVFQRGLLSDLDRKTIEPIALSFLGEKDVRGSSSSSGAQHYRMHSCWNVTRRFSRRTSRRKMVFFPSTGAIL